MIRKNPKYLSETVSTIKLLRFPFSLFLLPVSLFSFFCIQPVFSFRLLLVIITWHLIVFPSSNGYNSYHDRDEGPIGGLASPPKPTKLLLYLTGLMDITALLLSLAVNYYFAFFVAVYIFFSRLYSNRKIRLKKFPLTGFLIVLIFQGAWVFYANVFALAPEITPFYSLVLFPAIACSFFIATIYPLTQIYQHESDDRDGVKTISMLLGIKGTFVFSTLMFCLATFFIYLTFRDDPALSSFWIFNVVMLPATLYFLYWALKSFRNKAHVNFKNTMIMLMLSSFLNNLYFLILLFK